MRLIIAAALFVAPIADGRSQETRTQADPPDATIADIAWLEGQWDGTGIGGNRAMESWLPAIGGTMVGTFVQTDGEGGIQFTEHLYLMEEGGSLVLRLKHFNADLTGWEDAEEMLTFHLDAIEPCAAQFSAVTFRCDGDDGLVVTVQLRSDEGEPSELRFDFTRAG